VFAQKSPFEKGQAAIQIESDKNFSAIEWSKKQEAENIPCFSCLHSAMSSPKLEREYNTFVTGCKRNFWRRIGGVGFAE
jgi:hypothetical protein